MRSKEKPPSPVGDPSPAHHDAADRVVEYLLQHPKERAAALATAGIKSYDEELEMTMEEQALLDITTGMAKVTEYMSYVNEVVAYYQATGKAIPVKPVLDKITGITGKLGKLGKLVGNVKQYHDAIKAARGLMLAADEFVSASMDLEMTPESIKRWLASANKVRQKAEPFISSLKSTLYSAAVRGGVFASKTLVVVQYVDTMFTIGTSALDNSTKVVEIYWPVLHEHLRKTVKLPDVLTAR